MTSLLLRCGSVRGRVSCGAVALFGLGVSGAVGGPIYQEPRTDAGSFKETAAITEGPERQLEEIHGRLVGGTRGEDPVFDDYEDMYLIRIVDVMAFSAETVTPSFAGSAFNTQLWLFDLDGRALLANNELNGEGTGFSRLVGAADDGTGAVIPGPGLYYIAISGAGNVPTSGGLEMFNLASRFEVSGPDGPGGMGVHDGWSGPGAFGSYIIRLTGVEAVVPAPGGVALLVAGGLMGVGGLRRRRRQV